MLVKPVRKLCVIYICQNERIILKIQVWQDRCILSLVGVDNYTEQHVTEVAEELRQGRRLPEVTRLSHFCHKLCARPGR